MEDELRYEVWKYTDDSPVKMRPIKAFRTKEVAIIYAKSIDGEVVDGATDFVLWTPLPEKSVL